MIQHLESTVVVVHTRRPDHGPTKTVSLSLRGSLRWEEAAALNLCTWSQTFRPPCSLYPLQIPLGPIVLNVSRYFTSLYWCWIPVSKDHRLVRFQPIIAHIWSRAAPKTPHEIVVLPQDRNGRDQHRLWVYFPSRCGLVCCWVSWNNLQIEISMTLALTVFCFCTPRPNPSTYESCCIFSLFCVIPKAGA